MNDETSKQRLGWVLRAAREQEKLTQTAVARRMNEPREQLYRAELGQWVPHQRFLDAWVEVMGELPGLRELHRQAKREHLAATRKGAGKQRTVADDATLVTDRHLAPGSDDDVNRRELLAAGVAVTGGVLLPGAQPADMTAVAALEHAQAALRDLYRTHSGFVVVRPLRAHLALLEQGMPGRETLQQRVLACVAETRTALGCVEYFDLGNRPAGREHIKVGMAAAKQSGNATVLSLAISQEAVQVRYEGRQAEAIAALQTAVRLVERNGPPVTRSFIASQLAEALALAGDSQAAFRTLDESARSLAAAGPEGLAEHPAVWGWSAARHETKVTAVHLAVRDGRRAEELAREGLRRLPDGVHFTPDASRCILLGDLAHARALLGDVEASCASATELLDLADAGQAGVNKGTGAVRKLVLGPLRRYSTAPPVQALQERLLSAGI